MSEPFLGQISIVAFTFAPRGHAFCDGQVLPISQNQALFALLGSMYGGDGRTVFALPDLRGRVPIHFDSSHPQGSKGGEESHVLTTTEMPAHSHVAQGSADAGTAKNPSGRVPAVEFNGAIAVYGSTAGAALKSDAVQSSGNGQFHENMQPFRTLNFIIATQGIFPSRN